MMLCLLPSVAFAKDMSWTWTVTIIGGKYYNDDGTEFSINRYKINKHLDDSIEHEIGYTFQWDAGAGGTKYNDGWQLCLTVDGKIVEESRAYIYEKDMRKASDSWTAPASSHSGNTSHPFTLYLSDYQNRFQNITLSYVANGGTGTPEPQTQTVESGKEATFTVNSKEPTRTNYDFKGWSTDKNATTASYHGGESIKISKYTTLYAVWANPNPSESPAPSEKPEPTATPTPNIPWVPGHDHNHNHNNNGVPPIVYIPPKTGDMPFCL